MNYELFYTGYFIVAFLVFAIISYVACYFPNSQFKMLTFKELCFIGLLSLCWPILVVMSVLIYL